MAINKRLYPREWAQMRAERLEQVGYVCELCGMLDGTERVNARKPHPLFPEGKPSRMWLQLCHKRQYQTWNREAETVVLCPPCHRRFDQQFRRRAAGQFAPCGLVWVWLHHEGARLLAAEAWSYDDLLQVIGSFAIGMVFDLEVEALRQVVGTGRYRRLDNGVQPLAETGACTAFGLFLEQVLQGVSL